MSLTDLYARLLRLYPRAFYERFGDEMLDVFTEAQADHRDHFGTLRFAMHEFGGLLLAIFHERWLAYRATGRPLLFDWRLMPFILLGVSILLACIWSLSYWGYIVQPSSIYTQVVTTDTLALVRFDAAMRPTAVPLSSTPHQLTEVFPPSQILAQVTRSHPGIVPEPSLDARLADQVAVALSGRINGLGHPRSVLPRELELNPDGCDGCFITGLQLEADGSLSETWPEIDEKGEFTGSTVVQRLTPNGWTYYLHIMPAGYIAQGRDADGTPLVFVAASSNASGGDRYIYHELLYDASGDTLVLRASQQYRYDVAGLEGLTVPVVAPALFVPLFLVWLVVLLITTLVRRVRRHFSDGPRMTRA